MVLPCGMWLSGCIAALGIEAIQHRRQAVAFFAAACMQAAVWTERP
jgi:hypothetical protein